MSSHFPCQDPDRAAEFALGYFARLRADPDIRQTWLGLRALIQVHIQDPEIAVHVDTRDGETMTVTPGVAPEPPALTLTLHADTFHCIYSGEMNVFLAFATRKIKTKGNVALIMKTTWTLPQAIRIYRQYGSELGLPGFQASGGSSRTNDTADRFTRLAAEVYCQEVAKHSNRRGGRYQPGLYSVTTHVALGLAVGATPDGRRSGAPLSQGISPVQGRDRQGPTAAVKSAARLNHTLVSNGSALNQKVNPAFLRGSKGPEALAGLLSGYFRLGGMQVQWNLVDSKMLQAAQHHPEDYADLIVRVSGYSAYFTNLEHVVQNDIIARMEHVL